MPYLSLPNEADARAAIHKTVEVISPGVLPPGLNVTKNVGPYSVEFSGRRTRTTVEISQGICTKLRGAIRSVWGQPVLTLGKTFHRGMWEAEFGVQLIRYSAHSRAPIPDELIRELSNVVDHPPIAMGLLGRLKEAMDGLGEYVDCIQQRAAGIELIDIICNELDPTFLVILAVVLRCAGARSRDAQSVLDMAEHQGVNTDDILLSLLGTAERVGRFDSLMAVAPDEDQVTLLRRAVERRPDLLGWVGYSVQDENHVRDLCDRLMAAIQQDGLELIAKRAG